MKHLSDILKALHLKTYFIFKFPLRKATELKVIKIIFRVKRYGHTNGLGVIIIYKNSSGRLFTCPLLQD